MELASKRFWHSNGNFDTKFQIMLTAAEPHNVLVLLKAFYDYLCSEKFFTSFSKELESKKDWRYFLNGTDLSLNSENLLNHSITN